MEFKYTDFFEPKDISIEKCWMVIAGALFKDRPVSEIQREEMRKAFYIGFSECFKIFTDLSSELSENEASDVLTRINNEANDFHEKTIADLKK